MNDYTAFLKTQPGSTDLMYYSERGNLINLKNKLATATSKDVNTRNQSGNTALIMAASKGHVEIVDLLLKKGADVNAKNDGKDCAITYAAFGGKYDVVKILIENGADIEARNNIGETPLMLAASQNHVKVVELLLTKGAEKEARNQYGNTALILAALENRAEAVNILIENGADIEARNKIGDTALMLAAYNGRNNIVHLLIDKGADLFPRNKYMISAYDFPYEAISEYIREQMIQNLPNLMKAILESQPLDSIKKILAEHIHETNSNKETPLMYAVLYYPDKLDLAAELISNRARIDAVDHDGSTALMYAARLGFSEMMHLLLQNGANIFHRNRWGKTAADIAHDFKHTDTERILRTLMLTTIVVPMLIL